MLCSTAVKSCAPWQESRDDATVLKLALPLMPLILLVLVLLMLLMLRRGLVWHRRGSE